MQFLMLLKSAETSEAPPQALMHALGTLMGEMHQSGALLSTGGLTPNAAGVTIRVADGHLSRTDGPFTESKEVIGGFAMIEVASKEEAVELASRFMAAHRDHWPGWSGESEVRQVYGDAEPVAEAEGTATNTHAQP